MPQAVTDTRQAEIGCLKDGEKLQCYVLAMGCPRVTLLSVKHRSTVKHMLCSGKIGI